MLQGGLRSDALGVRGKVGGGWGRRRRWLRGRRVGWGGRAFRGSPARAPAAAAAAAMLAWGVMTGGGCGVGDWKVEEEEAEGALRGNGSRAEERKDPASSGVRPKSASRGAREAGEGSGRRRRWGGGTGGGGRRGALGSLYSYNDNMKYNE